MSDTHQIVRVVFTAVELLADEVFLTFTVSQLLTFHATFVQAHQLIWYSHPAHAMVIADAALIQATVIAADSVRVFSATFI